MSVISTGFVALKLESWVKYTNSEDRILWHASEIGMVGSLIDKRFARLRLLGEGVAAQVFEPL